MRSDEASVEENLPLELIAKTITSTSVDDLINMTEKAHGK